MHLDIAFELRHTLFASGADALSQLFPNRIHRTIDLSGSGCPAMAIVDGLTGLSAANPSAKVVVVDHAGVQVRAPPTWALGLCAGNLVTYLN